MQEFCVISKETWKNIAATLNICIFDEDNVEITFIDPEGNRLSDNRFDEDTLLAIYAWIGHYIDKKEQRASTVKE